MSRAVVVHHKVVDSQHIGVAQNLFFYSLNQLRIRALAKKGREHVPHQIYAAVDYEECYGQTYDSIKPEYICVVGENDARQDCRCGNHIIP